MVTTMRNEYSQRDQRVAVCLSSYRDGKKETVMDDAPAFDGSKKSNLLKVTSIVRRISN